MHRAVLAILTVLLLLPVAAAEDSPAFGGPGAPVWTDHKAPSDLAGAGMAAEPTIGIPWDTDTVFYMSNLYPYRITFDEAGASTWENVSPLEDGIFNADPMLHADPETGRVWAGGLLTVCSLMFYTDDEAASWDPTGNMCGVYGVDHQTIGSGPWAGSPPPGAQYDRAVYYCAHGEAISSPLTDPAFSAASPTACLVSLDGGVTWGPPVPWAGGCGSLHGHVRVSPATGFAAVPDADCATGPAGDERLAGFAYSTDNGATWMSRTVEGSTAYSPFDNPSLAMGHDEGWLWYGQAADDGAFIALSTDEGVSWEDLGARNGANSTTWFDVGALHDPPIVEATFPDVQVGDDDRVAFSFLGLEDLDGDGAADEYLQKNDCGEDDDNRHWHYYVAMSYDAGATWRVQKMSDDPVQVGGIFQGQEATPDCRNLLDFNDMDLDSQGRVHVSYADGCIRDCAQNATRDADGAQAAYASLFRQTTGNGLFAAFDAAPPGDVTDDTTTAAPSPDPGPAGDDGDRGIPTLAPILAALALLGAAAVLRRRA